MYEHLSIQYQRQVASDRHEQLRRAAGAARLRRDIRRQQHRRAPARSR
jgi:hypothetical protein